MERPSIKILIADDHELIRQGIKRILSLDEQLEVIAEAENGNIALSHARLKKPDVVLLDFNMPYMNGLQVLEALRLEQSPCKIILLTIEQDSKTIHEAIALGADGYVLKDSSGTEIVDAIKAVYEGEKYIDKSLVAWLFSGIKSKTTTSFWDSLSRREIEVLLSISKGFSNKKIGEQLFLSEKTVKNYATNLFKKLNVEDRVQATIFAIKNNLEDYYRSKF